MHSLHKPTHTHTFHIVHSNFVHITLKKKFKKEPIHVCTVAVIAQLYPPQFQTMKQKVL